MKGKENGMTENKRRAFRKTGKEKSVLLPNIPLVLFVLFELYKRGQIWTVKDSLK